jgi:hypothetical protein
MTARTTPEQDARLQELRAGLSRWLTLEAERNTDHRLCLTALMLFTASGVASAGIPREEFLDLIGRYYDLYVSARN